MGRRTYESLPNGALPNRRNIVISRTLGSLPGAEVYASIEEALSEVEQDEEVFVIGGGAIYGAFLPQIDKITPATPMPLPSRAAITPPTWVPWSLSSVQGIG